MARITGQKLEGKGPADMVSSLWTVPGGQGQAHPKGTRGCPEPFKAPQNIGAEGS